MIPEPPSVRPGGENAGSANRPDAVDLSQPIRRSLNNVDTFSRRHGRASSRKRANAPNHPGREVFLDAIGRSRAMCAETGFELLTVVRSLDPVPRRRIHSRQKLSPRSRLRSRVLDARVPSPAARRSRCRHVET